MDDIINEHGLPEGPFRMLQSQLSKDDPEDLIKSSPSPQDSSRHAGSMRIADSHFKLLEAGGLDPTESFDINTRLQLGGPLNALLPDSVRKYTGVDVPIPGIAVDPVVGAGRAFYNLYDNLGKYSKYSPGGQIYWNTLDAVQKTGMFADEDLMEAAADMEPLNHPTYEAALSDPPLSQYEEFLNSRDKELALFSQTPAASSISGIAGQLGAEVLMSLFIPLSLSKTVMGALGTGAALGGAQSLAFTRVPEGQSVLPYVALGAVLGGGIAGAFAKFGPMMSARLAQKSAITGGDIVNMSDTLGLKVAENPQQVADVLNAELSAVDIGTRKSMIDTMRQLPDIAKNLDDTDPLITQNRRALNALHNDDFLDATDFIDLMSGRAAADDVTGRLVARSHLDDVDTALGALDDMEYASAKEFDQLKAFRKKFGKQADVVQKGAQRAEKAWKEVKKAETMTEDIYNLKRKTWLKREQELSKLVGREKTVPTLDDMDEIYGAMDLLSKGELENISKYSPYAIKKAQIAEQSVRNIRKLEQSGMIDSQLLQIMAGGGIGAVFGSNGNPDDPLQGAMYGALLGMGSTVGIQKLRKMITAKRTQDLIDKRGLKGTAAKQMHHDGQKLLHWMTGYTNRKPQIVINSFGRPGRLIMHSMERARDQAEIRIGTELTALKEVLIKNDITKYHALSDTYENISGTQFRAYMQGELPNAPANIKRAGDHLKRSLQDILKEAEKVGSIDSKTYLRLSRTLKEKGYWPRIYNRNYLATNEGRDKFVEALASKTYNKESLRGVVATLVGEDSQYITRLVNMAERSGGHYYINRDMALQLLKRHTAREVVGRSTHLQHARRIHVDAEKVLNPFMVDDPMQVMTRYFDEVVREIENARHFGAKDEIFHQWADDVLKKYGKAEHDLVLQTYYTNVGDTKSAVVQAAINMPDAIVEILGSAGAWANLHLLFSQIVNFNQAGVFGSVYAARHGFKGVRAIIDASVDWARNTKLTLPSGLEIDAREWAAMTGADLETTMMQYIGEASAMNHHLVGNKITNAIHNSPVYKAGGKFNPLAQAFDTMNDPTKFLKTIMFTPVEKMQRQLGAVMGFRTAQMLYKEMDYVLSSVGPGMDSAAYKKVEATLKELGLPVSKASVSNEDMLVAGLRMSNKINFRNTAERIPLLMQHPGMAPVKRFKTFAFHTMDFLSDQATAKNWQGMGLYALLGATLGQGVFTLRDKVRSVVTGKEEYLEGEDTASLKRLQGGLMALGGFGLILDSLYSARDGKDLLQTLAGPAPSDLADIAVATATANPTTITNAFTKAAPPPIGIPLGYGVQAITGKNPLHNKKRKGGRKYPGRISGRSASRFSGL